MISYLYLFICVLPTFGKIGLFYLIWLILKVHLWLLFSNYKDDRHFITFYLLEKQFIVICPPERHHNDSTPNVRRILNVLEKRPLQPILFNELFPAFAFVLLFFKFRQIQNWIRCFATNMWVQQEAQDHMMDFFSILRETNVHRCELFSAWVISKTNFYKWVYCTSTVWMILFYTTKRWTNVVMISFNVLS